MKALLKNKNIYKYVSIGAISIGLISLTRYFHKQSKLLASSCYAITGAIINQISFSSVNFTLLLNVKNKSDITFTVVNQKYTIFVNGMFVADIIKKDRIKVYSQNNTTLKIDVQFNPQDLLKKGLENIDLLLADKKKMVIQIKGSLSLKAGLVSLKNYQIDEVLKMSDLLDNKKKNTKC